MTMNGARFRRRLMVSTSVACGALMGTLAAASPAAAQATACSPGAISALDVPGVTIVSATNVAATAPDPAYCAVTGTLNTSGYHAPPGSAGFEVRLLPAASWNGKFLFFGVGGLGGATYGDISANAVDRAAALGKGYATVITDTGHLGGNTDASWALVRPNVPDKAKVADYYYRATHEVTVAAKKLVEAFYSQPIQYSYFDGCSNGGHQAMTEASDYPNDYNGIISGAPFFDARAIIQNTHFAKRLVSSPEAYLPPNLLPMIDKAIVASCDAADGAADGLIQNPGACSFDASSLICTPDKSPGCLTKAQAVTLNEYFTATRDEEGRLVHTGFSVSDLTGGFDSWTLGLVPPTDFSAAEPWGNAGFSPSPIGWQFADHFIQDLVTRDPAFPLLQYPVSPSGTIDAQALEVFDSRLAQVFAPSREGGFTPAAQDYAPFLETHRKLLIYHGFSDQALSPFRTIQLYKELAELVPGGYSELGEDARLFMVPGMQHCGNGSGPNRFDTLTALEQWVEKGVAPNAISASHYTNNNVSLPVDRTMPLCKFPEEAKYSGNGNVADAVNWSCTPNEDLLKVGANGSEAGL